MSKEFQKRFSCARNRRDKVKQGAEFLGIYGQQAQPTPDELKFLEACEYGDIPTVLKILEDSSNIDVNCVDHMGENALQLACGNEHLEVVELLVKLPTMKRVGDALCLAISRGYIRIVEEILNQPAFQDRHLLMSRPNEQQDKDFYAFDNDGTRFSPDITPIVLAAQCEEFEIVHLLIRRGAVIAHPHHYRCRCNECTSKRNLDSLSYCLCRLNAYKALASPAYMSIAFADPARHALKLSHELTQLATVEKEFKNDYLTLASQCNCFLEKLLDLCRTTDEVNVLLNGNTKGKRKNKHTRSQTYDHRLYVRNPGSDFRHSPRRATVKDGKGSQHRQLHLAIKYKVKKFVAHPCCQQQLKQMWNKNLDWSRKVPSAALIAGLAVFMPVAAICYLCKPNSRIGKIIQSPMVKFAMQGISYTNFVLLLVINILSRIEGLQWVGGLFHSQSDLKGRATSFNWCEVMIMVYIAGMMFNELKEIQGDGLRQYFSKLWNIIDILMLIILIISFTCRGIAYHQATLGQTWWRSSLGDNATRVYYDLAKNLTYFPANESGTLVNRTVDISVPSWAGYYAYCRKERIWWHTYDPQLLAEALYSYGIVLSFSRVSYILEVNEKFGPLQISLARTVGDIMKWSGIFFVIFGAFMLGLFNLYSYYNMEGAKTNKSFTTLEETFITLFWSMFGLADYKGVEINYNHNLTRIIGYQLYGAYNIITVVIMLNMLIAMINSSYSEVECDSDVEWKFARAELMLSYFEGGSVLPVPYNLIPQPTYLKQLLSTVTQRLRRTKSHHRESKQRVESQSCASPDSITRSIPMGNVLSVQSLTEAATAGDRKQEPYDVTVRRIVKRFVLHAQIEKDKKTEITEAEFRELKNDITSLRYEMLGGAERVNENTDRILRKLEEAHE